MRHAALALVLIAPAAGATVQCPPAHGLPPDAATWCERADLGPDGLPGSGDENAACTINAGDGTHSPCGQRVATEWRFREGDDYCADCAYAFYVVVDCSTSMHVPNHDVEAMRVTRITDLATGAPVLMTVQNECAKRRDAGDALVYCDGCGSPTAGILRKDEAYDNGTVNKPAGTCDVTSIIGPMTLPEMPCMGLRRTGFDLGWGVPLDPDADGDYDEDDDGSVDLMSEPPCVTCGVPDCPCTPSTNMNPVTEEQVVDVVLHGAPLLSGVYRIEMLSGGLEWQLFSNCDGSGVPQFPIYDTCAAALAAWSPLPELALHDDPDAAFFVEDNTGCPGSALLGVTICNRSMGATSSAPFAITFSDGSPRFTGDNTAHPTSAACQGPLDVGECRTCWWDVPAQPGVVATLTIDPDFVVDECSESPSSTRCEMVGRRTQALQPCGPGIDTDGDGMDDADELNFGSNPLLADADGDGLGDRDEALRGSSANASDTDGDTVPDRLDTCPVTRAIQRDADGDGVGDACEPGARDAWLKLRRFGTRMIAEWGYVDGVVAHDLAAGDLAELWRQRAHVMDTSIECGLPQGFTGRVVGDPGGVGRSRFYVLGSIFPGPDDWGVTSRGDAIPSPVAAPGCR